MSDNICVCCGQQIPEGRQVCLDCETGLNSGYMSIETKETNGDRIRHMTDEELADWLTDGHDICDLCQFSTCMPNYECEKGVLEWLKQEVSEDG